METTAASELFRQANSFLDEIERKYQQGQPVGALIYLLHLVLEDIQQLGDESGVRR